MMTSSEVLPHVRLQFHMQHPVLEACWNSGYDAALCDLTEEDNPHATNTADHEHWCQGWWAGFYGEERLHDSSPVTEILSTQDCFEDLVTGLPAVNDDDFRSLNAVRWIGRFVAVAGVVAVAVAAFELLDIAV